MVRFITRRLGQLVIVFAGLVVVAFLMSVILPGDPGRAAAGRNATVAQVAEARHRLGLDRPLLMQFGHYAARILHGDLGTSVFTHQSVLSDIRQVLPSSVELVVAGMIINLVIAVPLGVLAAYRRGRPADVVARLFVLVGAAMPAFWLGLMLQLIFADQLKILPLSGQLSFGVDVRRITGATTLDALLEGNFPAFGDALKHLILPAIALSASFIAVVARTVRSSMITALDSDYIVLARATGAKEWRVVVRHGLRNALVPASTILGMQLGWMLGATVLVESTFNRTGLGAYMVTGVLQNDLYAVIGSILTIGVVFLLANFAVDLIQLWLNPRLRPRRRTSAVPLVTSPAPAGGVS
ncbi:MAG: transporter permease [Pseudonocardiales bacterium]|nr:transporter permease [Pseudonocardiales bacterium]